MDKDLEALTDRTRIIEIINQLFIGTDNRDWALVRRCMAPSVLFDMSSLGGGPPKQMTPDEITAMWDEGLRPLKAVHHQAGNHVVRLAGRHAEAFCYGIAIHYLPNPSKVNTRSFVGSYEFGFVKNTGSWAIESFRFNLKFIDGNPGLEKP
jgi:hypothetical protein